MRDIIDSITTICQTKKKTQIKNKEFFNNYPIIFIGNVIINVKLKSSLSKNRTESFPQ